MAEVSNAMVCILGVGTVFFGLTVIVLLCMLMSGIIQRLEAKKTASREAADMPSQSAPTDSSGITPEIGLALMAVLCEMNHINPAKVRIHSIRKI